MHKRTRLSLASWLRKNQESEKGKKSEKARDWNGREWIGLQRVNRLSTRREILLDNDVKLTIWRTRRETSLEERKENHEEEESRPLRRDY